MNAVVNEYIMALHRKITPILCFIGNKFMAFLLVRDDVARLAGRRIPVYHPRLDVDIYDDVDLVHRFRFNRLIILFTNLDKTVVYNLKYEYVHVLNALNRECIQRIHDIIKDDIEPLSTHGRAASSMVKLLCALRFYATGSLQRVTGDTVGLSQSSVSR